MTVSIRILSRQILIRSRWILLLPACLAITTIYQQAVAAQAEQNQSRVICSVERPVAVPGEAVGLHAWVAKPEGTRTYRWSVDGGRILGEGAHVKWSLGAVEPDVYTASVKVSSPGADVGTCGVHLVVDPDENSRGELRESARSLLLAGAEEVPGYALYSYILLGSPPSEQEIERYTKTLEAFLTLIPSLARLELYLDGTDTINLTYIPVTRKMDSDMAESLENGDYQQAAKWVLRHYDYARARVILGRLDASYREGPYVVSYPAPLTRLKTLDRPHLFQNASTVPPRIAHDWVREFLTQAAQNNYWDEGGFTRFALNLRTTVAVMSRGLKDVRGAIDELVQWRGATLK